MPAIPLDVLVDALTALDRARLDPCITTSTAFQCAKAAGALSYFVKAICEAQTVEVTTVATETLAPPVPTLNPVLAAVMNALVADLQHALRWHDQLTPADIERFKETIRKATTQ